MAKKHQCIWLLCMMLLSGISTTIMAIENLKLTPDRAIYPGMSIGISFDLLRSAKSVTINIIHDKNKNIIYDKGDNIVISKTFAKGKFKIPLSIKIPFDIQRGLYIISVHNTPASPNRANSVVIKINDKSGINDESILDSILESLRDIRNFINDLNKIENTRTSKYDNEPLQPYNIFLLKKSHHSSLHFSGHSTIKIVSKNETLEFPQYPMVSSNGMIAYTYKKLSERGIEVRDFLRFKSHFSITRSRVNYIYPIWSHNGQKLAMLSNQNTGDKSKYDIWTVNADGSNLKRLSYNQKVERILFWSKDNSKIVFSSQRNMTINRIEYTREFFILDLQSKNVTHIHKSGKNLDWLEQVTNRSPDGKEIIFQLRSRLNDQVDIWIMDDNGKNSKPLTRDKCIDKHPSWLPNGKGIVFVSNRDKTGICLEW